MTNTDICKLSNRIHTHLLIYGKLRVNSTWDYKILSPVYSRLYYISDGEFTIKPPGCEKTTISSGRWCLFPAGYSFDCTCESEMEHYYFHLKLCDYDGTDLLRKCKAPLFTEKTILDFDRLTKCTCSKNAIDALYLKQAALEVVLNLLIENNIDIKADNYSPCVMNAVRYIKNNLSVQLTTEEIANNCFISKSTLTKHFKNELSMSVGEYVCDLVMSGAEYMLSSSNDSIQAISEKYGFYDQFYFSRRFSEKFGQSPRNYRKNKLW